MMCLHLSKVGHDNPVTYQVPLEFGFQLGLSLCMQLIICISSYDLHQFFGSVTVVDVGDGIFPPPYGLEVVNHPSGPN
jgi:hypothetical protein